MKIKSLTLDNFAGFDKVSVSFDESITYLIGKNGSGKSTIGVTAIWAAFAGIAEKGKTALIGERFRFIGSKAATATEELVLHDEKLNVDITVKRKISKGGNEVSFEAPEGYVVSPQWLEDLFNVFLIAPKKFIELSSKEQAEALGIDTSSFDQELKALKSDYTFVNRDITSLGTIEVVDKAVKVDVSELNGKKNEILEFNRIQDERKKAIDNAKTGVLTLETEARELALKIDELKQKQKNVLNSIDRATATIENLPPAKDPKPTEDIDQELDNATETNDKAYKYQQYLEKIEKKKTLVAKLDAIEKKKKANSEKRTAYIRGQKLPFDNLEINEEGELLLSGKPIKDPYFSSGELLKIVPVLMSAKSPDLKYVFIQDFNLLDEDMQKEVTEKLIGLGMQLVIEIVGKEKDKTKNSILLKDCKVVENYDEAKTGNIL